MPFLFSDMQRELGALITGTHGDSGGFTPSGAELPNFGEPPMVAVPRPAAELTVGLLVSLGARTLRQPPLERTNDLSYRRIHRFVPSSDIVFDHATPARFWADTDLNVAFPRDRMVELEAEGTIGALAPTAISILGSISHWDRLATEMAPRIKDEFEQQGVDLVLVVPFCPQCHQATSILARALEARDMPTLMMSTLGDISEAFKPPRVALVDYPVGSPCGRTRDPEHQRETLRAAFDMPLDIKSRILMSVELQYQADGGRDWVDQTFDAYRARLDAVIENMRRHGHSESLSRQEDEFAIRCNC